MPEDINKRFKAIKSLLDICNDFEDEQQGEMRQLELMYEKLYDDVYIQRAEILTNKMSDEQVKDLVGEFNNKVKLHELDDSFKKLEVPPFEVKDTVK
jgi:hypothetical protein